MANRYRIDFESNGLDTLHKKEIITQLKEVINNVPIDIVEETSEDESIEDRLKNEDFKTPQEYYVNLDNIVTSDKSQQGFHVISNSSDTSERKWFWCEDLKNWCSYRVLMDKYEFINLFQLQVWNGKDNWMDVIWNNSDFAILASDDKYSIRKYQHNTIKALVYGTYDKARWYYKSNQKNLLEIKRGKCVAVKTDESSKISEKFYNQGFLLTANGFKLQKSRKYSINMPGTFQTIRWSTISSNNDYLNYDDCKFHGQTNALFYIPTSVPPVWRLPSGDLFLAATLDMRADNGEPYIYQFDKKNGGFKKIYSKNLFENNNVHVREYRMLGDNDEAAANWINKICASFFGDGNDKTIDKDWLRQDSELITEVQNIEQGQSGKYDMLDSEKVYEQNNINKENSLQCKFVVNRPVVTSEEIADSDYVKQW